MPSSGHDVAGGRRKAPQEKLCQDRRHPKDVPHMDVHKARRAGALALCARCRTERRKTAATVGNRGLRLTAYFRTRPGMEAGATATAKPPPLPGGDPMDMSERSLPPGGNAMDMLERSPPRNVPRVTAFMEDSPMLLSSSQSFDEDPTSEVEAATGNTGTEHEDATGSDCEDELAEQPLATPEKTLSSVRPRRRRRAESDEDEDWAAGAPPPPGTVFAKKPRVVHNPSSALPKGCLDVYQHRLALRDHRPPSTGLCLLAAPVSGVDEATRSRCEAVLHEAFSCEGPANTITALLGLRAKSLGSITLRSGRQTGRVELLQQRDRWLLWETFDDKIVGAAVLSLQRHTRAGPSRLRGGMVLEYISAKKSSGAKGHLMVTGAEELSRLYGYSELFSACDDNQLGDAFDGTATPAMMAHLRWGFLEITQDEWSERRFCEYTKESKVTFMVKPIPPADAR